MKNADIILLAVLVSVALYTVAAVLLFFEKARKIGRVIWIAAIALNAALVLNNLIINGYVPFVSMYQVLTFLALTFGALYLYVRYYYDGGWTAQYFCIAPAVCLTGVSFMEINSEWLRPPALQSVWFVPHILMYMIAYSLCTMSFILIIAKIFYKKIADKADGVIYCLIKTAFPFLTAGLFFGAMWANEVWCTFWSFDMKENWALVTWLMYAVYLHFYRNAALKKFSNIFAISGFVAIIITLFFVGSMGGDSKHAYSL